MNISSTDKLSADSYIKKLQIKHFAKTFNFCLILLIGAFFLLNAKTTIKAETFTVTKTVDTNDGVCDSDCSLREAIGAANAAATDDVIDFDATVFNLSRYIYLTKGGLDVNDKGSLVINGTSADLLTISGNNQAAVISTGYFTEATINNLKIVNGGGAFSSGGGIINRGNLIVNDCILKNNFATFEGGGVHNTGTLKINNSVIEANSSKDGGGIYNASNGNLVLNDSTVNNNRGGGISNRNLLDINNSTISGNIGGGIYIFERAVNITNSTISGNFRDINGGGIYISRGTLNLNHVTITANSGTSINGVGINTDTGAVVNAKNSIIAGNIGNSGSADFRGVLNSQGYNLIGDTSFLTLTGDSTGNFLNIDPLLLSLEDNGGATKTHHLQPESPAIDAGDPADKTDFDQRGISRPLDGKNDGIKTSDIGAVESGILVTNLSDSGTGSLRQAIIDANASATNDEIRFSSFFDQIRTISLTTGELFIKSNGKLMINRAGADKLTISGKNLSRVIFVESNADVFIKGLTISEGKVEDGEGAGLFSDSGSIVKLSDTAVINNSARNAGGIYNNGNLTIEKSLIGKNSAAIGSGGGIHNGTNGRIDISDSDITENTANTDGGGIYNTGMNLSLMNSSVSNNTAVNGAGIYHFSGAGIILNSLIDNNTAEEGGGIETLGTALSIGNSTISNNTANVNSGGGITISSGILNLTNVTVAFNSADSGGGISQKNSTSTVNAKNTLIAKNISRGASSPDFTGILTSAGYNLIGNTSGTIVVGEMTGNQFDVDPLLLSLNDNGGGTKTHALQINCPAIDAGDPIGTLATDQRGFDRVADGNGDGVRRTDIGAFEAGTLIANTNDNGPGSLRQALADARAQSGDDEIKFSTFFNSPQKIVLTGGDLFIGGNGKVSISGAGTDLLTISGNNQSRVFFVNDVAELTLNNLTVTDGKVRNGDGGGILNHGILKINNTKIVNNTCNGGGSLPRGGGGIFNNLGILDIKNSIVKNNTTSSGNGGGIINNKGKLDVLNTDIIGNTADGEGGGLYNFIGETNVSDSRINENKGNSSGGILNVGKFTLSNSTVNSNQALQSYGGIFNNSQLAITNSSINGNKSGNDGGGIYNFGFISMKSSTIAFNTARHGGGINNSGGLNNDRGIFEITNSTISNNRATVRAGAIFTVGGSITLTYSTIAFNYAEVEIGGIINFILSDGIDTKFNSLNSIIARNTAGNTSTTSDFKGNLNSLGHNILGDVSNAAITGNTSGNKINVNPLLDPILRKNGGTNLTHALHPNSPAVDAAFTVNNIDTDQRNKVRPFDYPDIPNISGGNGSDIGSFERQIGDIAFQTRFDFDGDGKTDISVFRPSLGQYFYLRSSDGVDRGFQFGLGSDIPASADYTGDGKTDIAFFRPSTGQWFVLRSEDASFYAFPFGANGDVPATGDFDSDGKADAAVFRPSIGTWFILNSSDGSVTTRAFGLSGDVPIVRDYDGDGKDDLAVYRPSQSEWYLQRSTAEFIGFRFGAPGDTIPTPADFTGDGKADIAFFAPSSGQWFVLRSEDTSFYAFPFGTAGDIPAPGDYDGDGKADAAIFRPSTGLWYLNQTASGQQVVPFGTNGDRPLPATFIP